MEWAQHGKYQLQWQGDILIARYLDEWNEVASQHLHQDAQKLWTAHGDRPWGLLSDASLWGGGTQECLDEWWLFFEDGVRHGMVAVTDILPSELHALIVSPLAERASQLVHYRRSFSTEGALQWLGEQGLRTVSLD